MTGFPYDRGYGSGANRAVLFASGSLRAGAARISARDTGAPGARVRAEAGVARGGYRQRDGLLARLFLGFGCEVFGVEPNAEMRAAGERELRDEARFHSGAGRAEATGLASGEFDLVTAGQAFHWFEPEGSASGVPADFAA